jgi:integrase
MQMIHKSYTEGSLNMASIRPYTINGKTRYQAQIRRHSRHLKATQSRSFDTKKEAQQWAKQVEQDLKNNPPETIEPQNSARTLKTLIEHYRQNDQESKKETTQRRQKVILRFWETRLGHKRLDALTIADVIKYRKVLVDDRKYKPGTVRQYLALLKAMLNVAVNDLEWIPKSPIAKLTLPKDSPPRERYLTKEEIHTLFQVSKLNSNRSFYPFIYLALHSALRYSELLNIKLVNINFHTKTILIPDTKNDKPHVIYLSQETYEVLIDHINRLLKTRPYNWRNVRYENNKLYCHDDNYLFPAETTDKPAYFVKAWRRARKAAGLDNSAVVFHTTRHTVLTHLANASLSDFELARIANHKDHRSTRRYTKGDPEKVRENFQLIGKLLK